MSAPSPDLDTMRGNAFTRFLNGMPWAIMRNRKIAEPDAHLIYKDGFDAGLRAALDVMSRGPPPPFITQYPVEH